MSSLSLPVLIGLIIAALAFDFLNGLHDTANSIATLVSTRMLRPRYAVMWAAFFNFIAFLVFGVHVARTIGVGIVAADVMDAQVIFGALTGAILWNLITWWAGIPSSSSHALIGGLVGAGLTKAGTRRNRLAWAADHSRLHRALAALRVFPCVILDPYGFVGVRACQSANCRAGLPMASVCGGIPHFARPRRQRCAENHGHHCSAAVLARSARQRVLRTFWVVITCQAAIGLGTLIGGWRIVRTVGSKITRMTPCRAVALRLAARSCCSQRPIWAFQSQPLIPSRER